jgi:antitoxin (DNA-binding transcriptional repressor) of toxin-antitoxin stability system
VPRDLTQREVRNDSGEIMRALDAGEAFRVTRNGVPVGELTPVRRRRFVARDTAQAAFASAAAIGAERFRADVDARLDQNPAPPGRPRGLLDTSVVIALDHLAAEDLPDELAIATITLDAGDHRGSVWALTPRPDCEPQCLPYDAPVMSAQPAGELVERVREHVVIRPQATALAVDDPGRPELLEMVRQRRLRDVKQGHELAHADLARVLA